MQGMGDKEGGIFLLGIKEFVEFCLHYYLYCTRQKGFKP